MPHIGMERNEFPKERTKLIANAKSIRVIDPSSSPQ